MTNSIRRKLTLYVVLATVPLFATGSFLLYWQVRESMQERFDDDLVDKARILSNLAELDEGIYEFEVHDSTIELLGVRSDLHIVVRDPNGSQLFRAGDLPPPGDETSDSLDGRAPGFLSARSRSGRPMRVYTYRFTPHVDSAEGGNSAALVTPSMMLTVGRDTTEFDAWLKNLAIWFTVVSGVLVAFTVLLARHAIVRGLLPLTQLASRVDALDSDNPADLPPENLPLELRPLVSCLNGLFVRFRSAIARERRFTADIAHELRTPLAIVTTETEVALRKPRTAEAYCRALEDNLSVVSEMTELVSAMMLIARVEAGSDQLECTQIRLAAIIDERWRAVVPENCKIRLQNGVSREARIESDPRLFRIAIDNLLANAAEYSKVGTEVFVRSSLPDGIVLEMTNNTTGLTDDQRANMFRRFWRADDARSDTANHSGLGLSVVSSVARALHFELSSQLDNGRLSIRLAEPTVPIACVGAAQLWPEAVGSVEHST